MNLDDITPAELRDVGWKKWTEFAPATGAWIAEMDFGTAPSVRDALRRAADGDGLGYLSSSRLRELQAAFTAFVADRFEWQVAPADVRLVPDVLTAFTATVRMFSAPGTPIILPTPAYMPFLTIPGLLDREVIQVPMLQPDRDAGGPYRYDLAALDAAFGSGAELMVLCNPHNPIGRVLERDELAAICAVVDAHGGRVFADEIHAPLVYAPHRHIPYASISQTAAGHAVTAMSTSKAFNLPGLKCAQVVLSNDEDRRTWAQTGALVEDQASTLGARAATAAYTGGSAWLAEVVDYLDGNRQVVADAIDEFLPGVRYTKPEGTYLAWLDFTAIGVEDPAALFRDADLVCTPGRLCGDAGHGCLRLNIATPRPILADIVQRMGAALGQR